MTPLPSLNYFLFDSILNYNALRDIFLRCIKNYRTLNCPLQILLNLSLLVNTKLS